MGGQLLELQYEKDFENARKEGREGIFKSLILDVLPSGNKNAIKTVMGQISRIGKLSTEKIQSIVQLVAKENNLKIPDGLFDEENDACAKLQKNVLKG